MKRFVSQKTRLIPNPRANDERTRRHVHLPKSFDLIPSKQEEDQFSWRRFSETKTPPHTNQEAGGTSLVRPRALASFLNRCVRDRKSRRNDKVGADSYSSQRAFGSARGWVPGLPRSAEPRAHRLRDEAHRESPPFSLGPQFHPR